MIVRKLNPSDIEPLRKIHNKFFKDEFPFSDFFGNSVSSFVVTDNNGKIIVGGQVRVIVEVVMITDKNEPIKNRRKAMLEVLRASMLTAGSKGFNQIHAFIQDKKWLQHLQRVGFKRTKGEALVLNI